MNFKTDLSMSIESVPGLKMIREPLDSPGFETNWIQQVCAIRVLSFLAF